MASNSFFLGGIDLKDITLARVDEREAIGTYSHLIEQVHARCGAEVASLFAEPVRGTNRATGVQNIAWYCGVEGTPFALGQIETAGRQPVVELLKQRLRSFSSLFAEPANGAVLASWLNVLSQDSIMAVAGQPVLKNWGMLANAVAASAEARDTHFRNGVGLYLPAIPTPPFVDLEAQSFGARMAQLAERETARAAPQPPPPVPDTVPDSAPPPPPTTVPVVLPAAPPGRPWLAPTIACIAALCVLLVLIFGHILRYPTAAANQDTAALDAQRQTNDALRERLERLRRAPPNACQAAPGGAKPGSPDISPILPPSPERTQVTPADPRSQRPESLGTLLDKATVLILAGDSLGSGFFISDRHVVTNHHVVGDKTDVLVGNRSIGRAKGKVVALGAGAERGTQDIAVIELAEPKPGAAFLKLGIAPSRLEQVTAAGYPGAVLETIKMESNSPLPEANFTQGIVTQHQSQQPAGMETIIHTAQIGHGNSGGPLVDAGGCAVGINAWLSFDSQKQVIFTTYFQALDAVELRRFLQAHNIAFKASDTSCRPAVASAAPTPSPQPVRTP